MILEKEIAGFGAFERNPRSTVDDGSVRSTILRFGRLSGQPGSGRVRTNTEGEGLGISRANVADCILEALCQTSAANRLVDLLDGDEPIEKVFARS